MLTKTFKKEEQKDKSGKYEEKKTKELIQDVCI
jgi:hypothetical protein